MGYKAQVVWCFAPDDPGMRRMAEGLHGKRFAAGDATAETKKSAIIFDWSPQWPELSNDGADIRLYIVAHGVLHEIEDQPPTVKIATKFQNQSENAMSVDQFFPFLSKLLKKSPAGRVRRISLAMCLSAGLKGEIEPQNSFAQKLLVKCEGLTEDITARMGELAVQTKTFPKAMLDDSYRDRKGTNPLFTTISRDNREESVVNAKKFVDGAEDTATYVFEHHRPPRRKDHYRE
jgi:hypothetical protein